MIPLSEPDLAGNEAAYLSECVESGYVSSVGGFVDRFEDALATLAGGAAVAAVSSGSAALHLAALACELPVGGEVWMPSCTFIATANAMTSGGAQPVFIDSAAESMAMDPALVSGELSRRRRSGAELPAAIVPVHIYGDPAPLEWLDLARELGVHVIEDAAESVGSSWADGPHAGAHTGTAAPLGCFSFNGNKLITAGGGGAVIGDERLVSRARHLSTQARIPGADYEHDAIGFNYRLTNLCAAVGLAQLERLEQLVRARRAVHERYVVGLRSMEGVRCHEWSHGANCWLSVAVFNDPAMRVLVTERLTRAGIQARRVWPPLHRQLPYRAARRIGSGHHSETWSERGLCLPSSPSLTVADQEMIIALIAECVERPAPA